MAQTPNRPQPDSPLSDIVSYINQNFDVIDDQDRTKIIKNGSVPTLLLGYQKGGFGTNDYGLKIAKAGVDVMTAPDSQLAYSSAFSTFNIVQTGIIAATRAANTTTGSTTINYDFSYTPMLIATSDGGGSLPSIGVDSSTGLVSSYITIDQSAFLKTITLTITAPNYAGNSTRTFGQNAIVRYYLLRDTAN